MTYDEWIAHAITNGYCGQPSCDTHDTVMTEADADAYFNGEEHCIWVTRLNIETTT